MIGIRFTEVLRERLKAQAIHARQVNRETLAAGGTYGCVKIGPLVDLLHDVGRAKALGTIPLPAPIGETKASLVESQNLQRFARALMLAALFHLLGKLF
jgi:hypothetical protein